MRLRIEIHRNMKTLEIRCYQHLYHRRSGGSGKRGRRRKFLRAGERHPRRPGGSQSGRERKRRKFSSTGERAPGYRLSPSYFRKFKRIPAPDCAQKMLCIFVPNRRQFLLSSFREFVHDSYCFDHGLSG